MIPLLLAPALAAGAPGWEEAWVEGVPPEALREAGLAFAEGRRGGAVRVQGPPEALDALAEAGHRVRDRRSATRAAPAGYLDAAGFEAALRELADRWPDRATLVELGRSVEGRPLLALRLGDPTLPAFRLAGDHHGDEPPSGEVVLAAAEALLAGHPPFEGLLDRVSVWAVPVVNPDGLERGSRRNARGVDLNRNYGYRWSPTETASGDAPFSEPETRAMRALAARIPFVAGLSLHAGATNLGWVWNWTVSDTVDEDLLAGIAASYADACGQPGFYATNGAEWYITYGDLNDWSYGMRGALDFTLEVSEEKTPPAGELGQIADWHLPAMATFLDTPLPLRGRVRDAGSGAPVEAILTFSSRTTPFATDRLTGRFDRPVPAVEGVLRAEAPGYAPVEVALDLAEGPVDLELLLEPDRLWEVRPEPPVLSRADVEVLLTLPDPYVDDLLLTRPGFDPVRPERVEGGWLVEPGALAPGPWTLENGDRAAPRALFAGATDDRVAIHEVLTGPDGIEIRGQGFADGTEVLALWGPERAPVLLEADRPSTTCLLLDPAALPDDREVDLLVIASGEEVAVVDVLGEARFDEEPPPAGGGEVALRAAGCDGAAAPAGLSFLLPLLLLPLRRRPCSS